MTAVAPAPAPVRRRQATDSWEAFCGALQDESTQLQRLNAAATHLTQILVQGAPEAIVEADRQLNAARILHQNASSKRRGMQARGFGTMTLQQVCQYAPRHMSAVFYQRLAELTYGSISLGITISNNKSLIVAGLQRLMDVTHKLQESMSEHTGVYKRRGYVAPPGASILVSSQV